MHRIAHELWKLKVPLLPRIMSEYAHARTGIDIHPGAILGGETVIGEEAVISSNVFITKSVPPHTRVSVKNPDLQYRNRKPQDFAQDPKTDWMF